jgi:hypothetical protein
VHPVVDVPDPVGPLVEVERVVDEPVPPELPLSVSDASDGWS